MASQKLGSLGPAPVYPLTELQDDAGKTLSNLLNKNHEKTSVLHGPKLFLHNHMPHTLGSLYLMGANSSQLEEAFTDQTNSLVPLTDEFVRTGINRDNWRDFLGQKPYTAAYTDFFDAEVKAHDGDWRAVVEKYVYSGPKPLLNGFSGGLGHPWIHLSYAYEFSSPSIATEALSEACTEYDALLHKYVDSSSSTQPLPDTSTFKTASLLEILERIRQDQRFDDEDGAVFGGYTGYVNVPKAVARFEGVILEYFTAWSVNTIPSGKREGEEGDAQQLQKQLEECLRTAAIVGLSGCVVHTTDPDDKKNGEEKQGQKQDKEYDFYLVHILTIVTALRVLLPQMPTRKSRVDALRLYGLEVIVLYIAQLRPSLSGTLPPSPPPSSAASAGGEEGREGKGKTLTWDDVFARALQREEFVDAHYPKVIRALRDVDVALGGVTEASNNGESVYLRAADEFVTRFAGWTGFGKGLEAMFEEV